MRAHRRLGQTQMLGELPDPMLALSQVLQDHQPTWVGQAPKQRGRRRELDLRRRPLGSIQNRHGTMIAEVGASAIIRGAAG